MSKIKALAFDVGGSVFDWKAAIIPTIEARISQYDASIDAEAFAMEWRLGMFVTLAKLHGGQIAQCNMDVMLAMSLDILLEKHPDLPLTEAEKADLLAGWYKMQAWEEFPEALERMKAKYTVSILSVLSFASLVNSSKHAGLVWDAIISCEFLSCYKQKPQAYIEGAALLGLKPQEVCFVAVHPSDLLSAKNTGMSTAYVTPKGNEPDVPGLAMPHNPADHDYDTETYLELCDQLGC